MWVRVWRRWEQWVEAEEGIGRTFVCACCYVDVVVSGAVVADVFQTRR